MQADLGTIRALGLRGWGVATAITIQNDLGVRRVEPLPGALVAEQLAALLDARSPDAVKLGMLGTADVAGAVAMVLRGLEVPVVMDPVLVSSSGTRLLDDDGLDVVRALLPRIALVTPNHAEAAALLGRTVGAVRADPDAAALALAETCPALLTGGDESGAPVDRLAVDGGVRLLAGRRVTARSEHGTGCLLSTVVACDLALGTPLAVAVARGKQRVEEALAAADPSGVFLDPEGPT